MIAVNINAGLANQMFHYAFGRGLINKGYDVYFDQTNFKPRSQWSFESVKLQDAFPHIELKQMPEGKFKYVYLEPENSLKYRVQLRLRRFHNWLGDQVYIDESQYGYIPDIERRITKNCIFKGVWQSEKYFSHCKEDIKQQFTFLPFDEEKNIKLCHKMKNEKSVAIHLRKGKDYLASPLMGHGLCGIDYYTHAIEYIRSHVESPIFYVFTDNPSWVIENLPNFDYTLVDWNDVSGKRNFRDMQLMTCAKHNIIANSTYSWWGAWLNPNPDKIVIGPKIFFNKVSPFFTTSDIMCNEWIAL